MSERGYESRPPMFRMQAFMITPVQPTASAVSTTQGCAE